jgi:hypothetical protein
MVDRFTESAINCLVVCDKGLSRDEPLSGGQSEENGISYPGAQLNIGSDYLTGQPTGTRATVEVQVICEGNKAILLLGPCKNQIGI